MLLKWVGGAYLIYLGLQALRHAGTGRVSVDGAGHLSVRQLFARGWVANAINPKVVLFFLSFLPQFVDASRGQVEWQLGLLGLVFTAQAAVLFGLIGFFAGSIGAWLHRSPRLGMWLDRAAGGLFVALGLRMILAR